MPNESAKQTRNLAGSFFASFIHPKTGKRIYAKDHGKKAFFIPDGNAKPSSRNDKVGTSEQSDWNTSSN